MRALYVNCGDVVCITISTIGEMNGCLYIDIQEPRNGCMTGRTIYFKLKQGVVASEVIMNCFKQGMIDLTKIAIFDRIV